MPSARPTIVPRAEVPLAPMTTLGVGGTARWFARATTMEEAASALRWSADARVEIFVLGGGSNVVVADEGFDGLVIQMALVGVEFRITGETATLRVAAGEPWDAVVAAAVSKGFAGLECLSGIPGTAGGTPIQNVGAYGQEVSQCITDVTLLDRTTGNPAVLTGMDCRFGYRTSRFKREDAGRFLVCGVTFELSAGPPTLTYPDVVRELERGRIATPTIADVRNAVLAIRRRKGMVLDPADSDTRSVGSFFTNPVVDAAHAGTLSSAASGPPPLFELPGGHVKVPAAWLIEHSGFIRGYSAGAVGISSKHPLAIVNRGGGTAHDVVALAARIKRRVGEQFGIWLRPEPTFVGFGNAADVVFLRGDCQLNVDTPD